MVMDQALLPDFRHWSTSPPRRRRFAESIAVTSLLNLALKEERHEYDRTDFWA